ncbi:MYB DNA-binding domain-containing protein [Magnaporthiopsis poae ATCC 64411]|uniref:MYB DNA-binding domain-containing protein n=1 Tax=Magnaporthiopsis poae (strain ATCC 64411 / 73-15) TaxID=644358 RepID=A0A0C4E7Y9_MAGP6|nr:MYB DNA-binding domain-containing protein [Magnaporthiopsis poae ATCC 64411]
MLFKPSSSPLAGGKQRTGGHPAKRGHRVAQARPRNPAAHARRLRPRIETPRVSVLASHRRKDRQNPSLPCATSLIVSSRRDRSLGTLTPRRDTVNVDIASLLKGSDSNESASAPAQQAQSAPDPPATLATATTGGPSPNYGYTTIVQQPAALVASTYAPAYGPGPGPSFAPGPPALGRDLGPHSSSSGAAATTGPPPRRSMPPQHAADSPPPAKKQSKWSPEEDAIIIELRGSGMKWEDISKRLPGRSSISCRLHYQNYLERRSEWDEERKNKLARLYERLKPEMWAKVAEEMQIPWRAVEAMHWQIGEQDMARRAGVVAFSLSGAAENPHHQRVSPSRSHHHPQSHGHVPRDILPGAAPAHYGPRGGMHPVIPPPLQPPGRPLATRRDSVHSRTLGNHHHHHHHHHYEMGDPNQPMYSPAHGLAPIQTNAPLPPPQGGGGRVAGGGNGGNTLPSVAELTTGVSPYSTPAYSVAGASPAHSQAGASPSQFPPSLPLYPNPDPPGTAKRRASPDMGRETSRRRHFDPTTTDLSDRSGPSSARRMM